MELIREAMYKYAKEGLPVIPLCSHDHEGMYSQHKLTCKRPGKCPLIRDWTVTDVPTTQQIDKWISTWPKFNIGLVLGSVSGIIGIDIDGTGGMEILKNWSENDLPPTLTFSTPNQGMRYLYRVPSNYNYRKVKRDNPTLSHTECALLGDGCQTVLPPSIHHNGGRYQWIEHSQYHNL